MPRKTVKKRGSTLRAVRPESSPVWIVSEGYLRAQYPFGSSTSAHIEMSATISIAEAMDFLARYPRQLFRDPKDRLASDYLRDLLPAGLTLGAMSEADLVDSGSEWPTNNYLILPKVRNPKFVDVQRDYRMWLFATAEAVRLHRMGRTKRTQKQ